ncbi:hypothetical protein FSP39_007270 [Pinctada imbricata]|uniref:Reverse transcriptase domain-containing protein n=1 Tax=Pinctada imbricata TaxID=66713 RepID=A0AA88XJV8_PINIB|nr:hypothetical protein FSP39_007270 [Pinctada imbricata]
MHSIHSVQQTVYPLFSYARRTWTVNENSTRGLTRLKRRTRRGTKAGSRVIRKIRSIIRVRKSKNGKSPMGANVNNLVVCEMTAVSKIIRNQKNLAKFYLINCRSVKNKSFAICDFIISNKKDIMAITETWLGSDIDKGVLSELVPDTHAIYHVPRKDRKGGGVALILNKSFQVEQLKSESEFTHMEHIECIIGNKNAKLRVCVVYRPPSSKDNNLSSSNFFEEWLQYLSSQVTSQEELLITGDINFHLDKVTDHMANRFTETLNEFGLKQYVTGPTHIRGHTLDVIICREHNDILRSSPTTCDYFLNTVSCDHRGILCEIEIPKPEKIQKTVSFRRYRDIQFVDMHRDIDLLTDKCSKLDNVTQLVHDFNVDIKNILDKHAPLQSKVVTIRPNTQWYSDELREIKHERQKAERIWHRTKLNVHEQIYKEICYKRNELLARSKVEFYSSKIKESESDAKQIYKLANTLMGSTKDQSLPSHHGDMTELANSFANFFSEKIHMIRCTLTEGNQHGTNPMLADVKFTGNALTEFSAVDSEDLRKIISNSVSKSCDLDAIPTFLFKEHLDHFLPIITTIVNSSLAESKVPSVYKEAIVRPLLKKSNLDKDVLKNYRPVSNLPFLSKVIEKVVAACIEKHLSDNNLHDNLQSAYHSCHSTETALLRVHHDITCALDNNTCAVLVMLDLSAAFDVIDHDILFRRLEFSYGITGSALAWIHSYLSDRSQRIAIGSTSSKAHALDIGVPQGSVLGPKFYCMFSKPVAQICRNHNMDYHCYADDTQIYMVIDSLQSTSTKLAVCLKEIKTWMSSNLLKLNDDKTEMIVFAPKNKKEQFADLTVSFGTSIISDARVVKNLGVVFDKSLTMDNQCKAITRSCYYHIRNIGRIRKYLTTDASKTLVNALVTSRLDYGNALLYGVKKANVASLQMVQNTAARLISKTKRSAHVTPILIELHWLPVEFRSQYKILLFVFKALKGMAPIYLRDLIKPYVPSRSLRSESALLLEIPSVRTKTYGERRFDRSAAILWNSLPMTLRKTDSLPAFKRNLKTFLFKKAFNI